MEEKRKERENEEEKEKGRKEIYGEDTACLEFHSRPGKIKRGKEKKKMRGRVKKKGEGIHRKRFNVARKKDTGENR